MMWGNFFYFENKLRHRVRHTCVHAASICVDAAREMTSEIPELFDTFHPQQQYVYVYWYFASVFSS